MLRVASLRLHLPIFYRLANHSEPPWELPRPSGDSVPQRPSQGGRGIHVGHGGLVNVGGGELRELKALRHDLFGGVS